MELPELIRRLGVRNFSRKFDITERAALSYLHGVRRPRPAVAQRIIDGSEVTWADIYAPARTARRKNGKRQQEAATIT